MSQGREPVRVIEFTEMLADTEAADIGEQAEK
jgi:hypothetical protein